MTKDGNLNRIVCNLGKLGNNSCSSTGEWTHCRYVFLGFLNKQESESKVYFVGECIPKEKECRKGGRERVKRGYQGEAIVTMATQDSSGERKKGEELSPSS